MGSQIGFCVAESLWGQNTGVTCASALCFIGTWKPKLYFISNVENVGCSCISHGTALLNSCWLCVCINDWNWCFTCGSLIQGVNVRQVSLYISLGYLQYSGHSGHLLQAEIGKKCSYEGYKKSNSFCTGEKLMWIVTLEETVRAERKMV